MLTYWQFNRGQRTPCNTHGEIDGNPFRKASGRTMPQQFLTESNSAYLRRNENVQAKNAAGRMRFNGVSPKFLSIPPVSP